MAKRRSALPASILTPIVALVALQGFAWTRAQPPAMPIHTAAVLGDLQTVQQHVAAGTDLDARDAYGSTPLIIAATFGHPGVVRALIDGGADLDVTNAEGSTALHAAAFLGRKNVVRLLLDAGANRYLRNDAGQTARSSLLGPFEEARPIYDAFLAGLGPLGLTLDYERLRVVRPQIVAMLAPCAETLASVDFAPLTGGAWPVSTPAAEGLDPDLVAEAYLNAGALEHPYALLVVKNGRLVAELYINGGAVDRPTLLQSVGKSFTSALVGLALRQGCFTNLDQPMLSFFPELEPSVTDERKRAITVRQMLQMRAGYPWEEANPALWRGLTSGDYLPLVTAVPLSADPGSTFQYSNLTSDWLAMIVARACGIDLRTFAQEHLFGPLDIAVGDWYREASGYYVGHGMLYLTARDAARFGLLYLQGGQVDGRQILPATWVRDSLRIYSPNAWDDLGFFHHVAYGYQWWSADVSSEAGTHHVDFAWGHGGQLIVLVPDLDMIVVLTSDPFFPGQRQDQDSWRSEIANLTLVSEFIRSLPAE